MSRSFSDWEQSRMNAIKAKSHLEAAYNCIEDWPSSTECDNSDISARVEKVIDAAIRLVDEMIGRNTLTMYHKIERPIKDCPGCFPKFDVERIHCEKCHEEDGQDKLVTMTTDCPKHK